MGSAESFEKGDIVRLKSGGPEMTVREIKTDYQGDPSRINCHWFSGAKRQSGGFDPKELEHVDEDEEDG